jgi:hypothetical protein
VDSGIEGELYRSSDPLVRILCNAKISDFHRAGDPLVDLARLLRDQDNAVNEKAREAELNRLIAEGIATKNAAFFKQAGKILEATEKGTICNNREEIEAYCASHPVKGVTAKMSKAVICMSTIRRDPNSGTIAYTKEPCHTAFTLFDGKGSASYLRHIQEVHLRCPKAESRNGRK